MSTFSRNRSIREIQHLFVKRGPLNLSSEKRRHPKLVAEAYAVKPFLGWKQLLEQSQIDYAKINVELEDRCTCLICGAEGKILTTHLLKIPELTPAEYRKEYPGTEIITEILRAERRRAKAAIPHWEPLWSWEYVLDRAWEFHKKGCSLNAQEIQRRERPMFNYVWQQGRTWDEVLHALGLDPKEVRKNDVRVRLEKDDVVKRLKARSKAGQSLSLAVVTKEDMRLVNATCRQFGSYSKALKAAGFDLDEVRLKVPRVTAKHLEKLKAEMERVASMHGHKRAEAALALKRKYTPMVFNRVENWRNACRKFGIKWEDLATHPHASKEHVIEGLRRFLRIQLGAHLQGGSITGFGDPCKAQCSSGPAARVNDARYPRGLLLMQCCPRSSIFLASTGRNVRCPLRLCPSAVELERRRARYFLSRREDEHADEPDKGNRHQGDGWTKVVTTGDKQKAQERIDKAISAVKSGFRTGAPAIEEAKRSAGKHGEERWQQGYRLRELLLEIFWLRTVLFREAAAFCHRTFGRTVALF